MNHTCTKLVFGLALLVFLGCLKAQNGCIYKPRKEKEISEERKADLLKQMKTLRTAGVTTLPVQVHMLVNSQGGQQDITTFKNHLNELNQKFLALNIQFSLCGGIDYIYNDEYDRIITDAQFLDIGAKFNAASVINVFYVSYIEGASGYYTNYASPDGFIVVQNNLPTSETLIHEFGHFFGLPHTHDYANGKERVDGSNCTYAGDKICDTPADPYLGYHNVNTNTCIYSGTERDEVGQAYQPDTKNFMSYAPFGCRNKFSTQQYDAMLVRYANTLSNIGYLCADKPDYAASLKQITQLTKGSTINITATINNFSNYNFTTSALSYRLTLTGSNQQTLILATGTIPHSIGPNYTQTIDLPVTIPSTLDDDTYTLRLSLDPDNSVSELNENNNHSQQQVGIYSNSFPKPDISITAVGPNTMYAGHNYDMSITTKNIGNDTSKHCIYRVYRSNDTLVDGSDIELDGGDYSSIVPGRVINQDVSLAVSEEVGKTYYLIVTVDVEEAEVESNRKNNSFILKVTTLAPTSGMAKADYQFASASIGYPGTVIKRTRRVGVTAVVKNTGGERNYNMSMATYYSKDNVLDSKDIRVWSQIQRFYNSAEQQLYFMGNVPKEASIGSGYIIVVVDDLKLIGEENEYNNTYALPITVEAESDGQLEFLNYNQGDTYWQYGKTIQVTGNIINKGNATASPPLVEFFLLKDKTMFQYYYFYGIWLNNMIITNTYLPVNSYMPFSYSKEIKETELNPGEYDLVACLHYGDEKLNCMAFPKRIMVGDGSITDVQEQDVSAEAVTVFPNPSTGFVQVKSAQPNFKVLVYSLNGALLKSQHMTQTENMLDLSSLSKGMYYITIEDTLSSTTKMLHLE